MLWLADAGMGIPEHGVHQIEHASCRQETTPLARHQPRASAQRASPAPTPHSMPRMSIMPKRTRVLSQVAPSTV